MRPSGLLPLLALLAAVAAAQKSVFMSADAANGDGIVVASDGSSDDDSSSSSPLPRLAVSPNDRPPRQTDVQSLGKRSDLAESDDDGDEDDDGPNAMIVGGKTVPAKLRKHLARVIVGDGADSLVACTGSVIARKYVLSAAYCFVDVGKIEIGEWCDW